RCVENDHRTYQGSVNYGCNLEARHAPGSVSILRDAPDEDHEHENEVEGAAAHRPVAVLDCRVTLQRGNEGAVAPRPGASASGAAPGRPHHGAQQDDHDVEDEDEPCVTGQ